MSQPIHAAHAVNAYGHPRVEVYVDPAAALTLARALISRGTAREFASMTAAACSSVTDPAASGVLHLAALITGATLDLTPDEADCLAEQLHAAAEQAHDDIPLEVVR